MTMFVVIREILYIPNNWIFTEMYLEERVNPFPYRLFLDSTSITETTGKDLYLLKRKRKERKLKYGMHIIISQNFGNFSKRCLIVSMRITTPGFSTVRIFFSELLKLFK